jgi:hypothetical protein
MDELDDAAAAALMRIWGMPRAKRTEYIVGLHGDNADSTEAVSSGDRDKVSGTLRIPKGQQLRALVHNHPPNFGADARRFSDGDMALADRAGVPSYIGFGNDVRRYMQDSGNFHGEPVLAQFPIKELRLQIMREILRRDADDPRGTLR